MSDEQQPSSGSTGGTRSSDAESGVTHFLQGLASRNPLLSSPVPEAAELSVRRRRSEWATSMLGSEQFNEAIQLLNEKVLQDIFNTTSESYPDPGIRKERLVELSVKLRVITEFSEELMQMVDEYAALAEIQEQNQRRELERSREDGDPYDGSRQPNEVVI